MTTKIEKFIQSQSKKDLPDIHTGDTVRVFQKIQSFNVEKKGKGKGKDKEKDKDKIQVFEGLIIAIKHGKELGGTFTVRKIISEVGVEKIFPIHSPNIEKIEIKQRGKVRRGKLYYLRTAKERKAKLKKKKIKERIIKPTSVKVDSDTSMNNEAVKDKPSQVLQDKNSENKENTEKKN